MWVCGKEKFLQEMSALAGRLSDTGVFVGRRVFDTFGVGDCAQAGRLDETLTPAAPTG